MLSRDGLSYFLIISATILCFGAFFFCLQLVFGVLSYLSIPWYIGYWPHRHDGKPNKADKSIHVAYKEKALMYCTIYLQWNVARNGTTTLVSFKEFSKLNHLFLLSGTKIKTQPSQRSCCHALTQCPKTFRILYFVAILGNQVQKSYKKILHSWILKDSDDIFRLLRCNSVSVKGLLKSSVSLETWVTGTKTAWICPVDKKTAFIPFRQFVFVVNVRCWLLYLPPTWEVTHNIQWRVYILLLPKYFFFLLPYLLVQHLLTF